jgi:predicted PurR-regulated permease PerM
MAAVGTTPERLDLKAFTLRVVVALALAAAAAILFRWLHVLLLAFGALLVAVLLRGLASPIQRYTRLKPGWALAVAILGILVLLGGASVFAGQQITAQILQLQADLPRAWPAAERGIASVPGGAWVIVHLKQASNMSMSGLGPLAGHIGRLAGMSVDALAQTVVILVAGIYFAAQPGLYRNGLLGLLPARAREPVALAAQDSGEALRKWLLGTGLAMLAMGVLVGIGARLLGLPAPLALGLLSGLAEFVPVVGAAVSAVPALLLAAPHGPRSVEIVLLFYVAVHQFEGHVLIPLIQRRMVAAPPAMTIFAILGFGVLFGPLGVVFATPLAVVVMVVVRRLYRRTPSAMGSGRSQSSAKGARVRAADDDGES